MTKSYEELEHLRNCSASGGRGNGAGEKAACNLTERIANEMLVKHGFSGNTVPVWKTNAAIVKAVKEALTTFPRTSQNQTVSSGVEGAHEGITAEKHRHFCEFYSPHNGQHQCRCGLRTAMHMSAEDKCVREPEKLNNAQECPDCAGAGYDCVRRPMGGYGHQNVQCWTCKGTGKVALAESSLSSPPSDDELLSSMAEKTARRVGLCFGTEQYKRESDLVQATNAVFRTLVKVRDRAASPELLPKV